MKLTLQETYLNEKDLDSVNKELGGFKSLMHSSEPKDVNKELGGFKSVLHGPSNAPAKNSVDKELDNTKWELSEADDLDFSDFNKKDSVPPPAPAKRGFNTKPEDPFADAFNKHDFKEHIIEPSDEIDPLDSLEHVSLVIHPTVAGQEGDCNGSHMNTFQAPGGPGFDSGDDGKEGISKIVLQDGELTKEQPELVAENDPFNEFDPTGFDAEGDFDAEEDEEWLSYLSEPNDKSELYANDVKGRVMPPAPTPIKGLEPVKKEAVTSLKNRISEVRKAVLNVKKTNKNVASLKEKLSKEIKNVK